MHGTVGVAPAAFEARSSLVPDAHSGNMDTPEMRAGVTCYLGVNVEGALLSLGDGHCRQGEGESCGVASARTSCPRPTCTAAPTPACASWAATTCPAAAERTRQVAMNTFLTSV